MEMKSEWPVLPQAAEIWQQTLQWQPDPAQSAQFQQLYELVLAGNRQLNLTRITEPDEFWEKHLWDSLRGIQPLAHLAAETLAIDIGTGAGFPGLPIAIAQPTWTLTLLDSTRKKMAFLNELLAESGLHNAKTLTDRVEQTGHHPHHRGRYDLALIRAVATAAACAEYALPLLKVGGTAVLYRGQWTAEEAEALQLALAQLGGKLEAVEAFKTPLSESDRHCLYLCKTDPTPAQFPRPVGVPTRVPLL